MGVKATRNFLSWLIPRASSTWLGLVDVPLEVEPGLPVLLRVVERRGSLDAEDEVPGLARIESARVGAARPEAARQVVERRADAADGLRVEHARGERAAA